MRKSSTINHRWLHTLRPAHRPNCYVLCRSLSTSPDIPFDPLFTQSLVSRSFKYIARTSTYRWKHAHFGVQNLFNFILFLLPVFLLFPVYIHRVARRGFVFPRRTTRLSLALTVRAFWSDVSDHVLDSRGVFDDNEGSRVWLQVAVGCQKQTARRAKFETKRVTFSLNQARRASQLTC